MPEELTVEIPAPSIEMPPPFKTRPNEPYSIRYFNFNRTQDTQRFTDMDRHPNSYKKIYPYRPMGINDKQQNEMDIYTRTDNPIDFRVGQSLMLAICDQTGEAVGWVTFHQSPDEQEIREIIHAPADALVLELAYGKSFNSWPQRTEFIKKRTNLDQDIHTGVAGSGLRQGMDIVISIEQKSAELSNKPIRPIIITATTDLGNTASEKVLEKNGFTQVLEASGYTSDCKLWYKKA